MNNSTIFTIIGMVAIIAVGTYYNYKFNHVEK